MILWLKRPLSVCVSEPAVKAQLEALYASFWHIRTDAINIFLHTSLMEGGFPFQPKQPRYNAETEAAIQETKEYISRKNKSKIIC